MNVGDKYLKMDFLEYVSKVFENEKEEDDKIIVLFLYLLFLSF